MTIKKYKVMAIEDSPVTTDRYRLEIGDSYEVDFYPDARSALLDYQAGLYDLLVTDLMLPFKSGEALIFDIQYLDSKQKIAVISGSPESLNLQNTENVRIFEKPISIKHVIDCMLLGAEAPKPFVNPDHFNQRRYPRFEVDLNARIHSGAESITGRVVNLSLGGVFLEIYGTLSIEVETVGLELPILGQKLMMQARPRWKKSGNRAQQAVGVGAQFHEIGHSEHALVELYLESLKS